MKSFTIPFLVFTICVSAQTPVAPGNVLFKVGGKPVTAAEFERLMATFTPEIQQAAKRDPKQVMQSYFLMQSLGQRAIAEKLDQTSPYKEQLELQRMQFLAGTLLNRESARLTVSEADQQARYEADKAKKYEQVKVRAIAVMFSDPKTITAQVDMADPKQAKVSPLKGVREEPEARAIAGELVKQLRSGADFAVLARQKSDDKTSALKGGDFGVIRRSDRVPDDIKAAVFAMKPGEISDPVRQLQGYYILKVDERSMQPFSEVQQLVVNELKQEQFAQWMAGMQKQFEVTVEDPGYFAPKPSATQAK